MHPSLYLPVRKPTTPGIRFKAILASALLFSVWIFSMEDARAQQDLQALNQRVIQLYQAGQKDEAISLAEKTVEMARSKFGPEHKTTGILLSQLGNLYRDAGRFAEAETALKR
jgi:tetratricopeptide (TPR) repeat protein